MYVLPCWNRRLPMNDNLLCEMNAAVHDAGGCLPSELGDSFRQRYRSLLLDADAEAISPLVASRGFHQAMR